MDKSKKNEQYETLKSQIESVICDDKFMISSLSNISAVLMEALFDINWVGFYLRKDDMLYLGPFQGKLACVEIKLGKGVCGTAAQKDQTQCVEDVHQFVGHIACDCNTNSEIVIPIHRNGKVVAVLDIDSTAFARFDQEDQDGLEAIVKVIEKHHKDLFVSER